VPKRNSCQQKRYHFRGNTVVTQHRSRGIATEYIPILPVLEGLNLASRERVLYSGRTNLQLHSTKFCTDIILLMMMMKRIRKGKMVMIMIIMLMTMRVHMKCRLAQLDGRLCRDHLISCILGLASSSIQVVCSVVTTTELPLPLPMRW